MNIKDVRLSDLETTVLDIGYVGENDHTRIRINCTSVYSDNPNAVVYMTVKPPQGDEYTVSVTVDGVIVMWDVSDSDLIYPGSGSIQLTFTDDGEVIKTAIGATNINESLAPGGQAPTPVENWLLEAQAALTEIEGFNNITASATQLSEDADPTAEITEVNNHKNIALGIPAGQSGMMVVDTVTGATPSITGQSNHRYVCGTVTSISITPPQSGIMDVVFTSGATAAVLTVPNTVIFPEWFDKAHLDANKTYEINIMDGVYAVVGEW